MKRLSSLTVAEMQAYGKSRLTEHYDELCLDKEIVKLDVDWERYAALEKLGKLFTLALWEDAILIGYSVFILHHHLHYKSLSVASNDVLFLREDKRSGRAGLQLILESEHRLKDLGVQKITWRVKYKNPTLGHILRRLGYADEEFTLTRTLKD